MPFQRLNKVFGFSLSKRQQFVVSILFLSVALFLSEFSSGFVLIVWALALSFLTVFFLYSSLRRDIRDTFFYPIFILPAFYTASFVLFYPLVPERLLTRIVMVMLFALGLYSLYLAQNIFAVSAIRTINLMRSARIVSFVLTVVTLFILSNVIFSWRFPIFVSPVLIFVIVFLLSFQSLWTYALSPRFVKDDMRLSALTALVVAELSLTLIIWPINAAVYSIFVTGIFYTYSGLTHAWVEKRLFKGVLWEYIWVGFLAVLILLFFSRWGL